MVKKTNKNNYIYIIIITLIIFFIILSYLIYNNYKLKKENQIFKKSNNTINSDLMMEKENSTNYYNQIFDYKKENDEILSRYNSLQSEYDNKVCISVSEFNKLKSNRNDTINRDYRVLYDELYPPLNRSDTNNHTNLANNIMTRNMYIKTNDVDDTYRLVAYVTSNSNNKDIGNNSWKLFGRQKDRHFSEFYITPTNNNNDVKIFLTDDIIIGDRIRDMYAIPNTINFKSPLLNETPYQVVEIPKQDISYNSLNYM